MALSMVRSSTTRVLTKLATIGPAALVVTDTTASLTVHFALGVSVTVQVVPGSTSGKPSTAVAVPAPATVVTVSEPVVALALSQVQAKSNASSSCTPAGVIVVLSSSKLLVVLRTLSSAVPSGIVTEVPSGYEATKPGEASSMMVHTAPVGRFSTVALVTVDSDRSSTLHVPSAVLKSPVQVTSTVKE